LQAWCFPKDRVALLPRVLSIPDYAITKLPNYQILLDPASQLQRIYLAGFELQTFDRFPRCVGVIRDGCIAMLVPGTDGFQVLGTPGWRMGEAIGVLLEKNGQQVFQYKQEVVEATPERRKLLERFKEDLKTLLVAPP
jgi:hypothetical protein